MTSFNSRRRYRHVRKSAAGTPLGQREILRPQDIKEGVNHTDEAGLFALRQEGVFGVWSGGVLLVPEATLNTFPRTIVVFKRKITRRFGGISCCRIFTMPFQPDAESRCNSFITTVTTVCLCTGGTREERGFTTQHDRAPCHCQHVRLLKTNATCDKIPGTVL